MPVNTFVENTWYVAGRSQDFPVNQPKGLRLCSRPVLLWRTAEGKLTAFDDRWKTQSSAHSSMFFEPEL